MDGATFAPDQLLTLHRLGKLVTASLDLDATLAAIVEAVQRLTGAHLAAIFLVEGEASLVLRAGLGDMDVALGDRLRLGEGIIGRALDQGSPVLVPDMLAARGRARPELDARLGTRAYLAAPLIWRDQRLGAVTVGALEPGGLTENDAALVAELAELAAVAVANARLYTQELERRAETEQLNELLVRQSDELRRIQRQLVENEKLAAIGQLAHGIAHEMNTPLGVIISNLSVLGDYSRTLGSVAVAAQNAFELVQAGAPAANVAAALQHSLQDADLSYVLDDLPQLIGDSTTGAERLAAIVRSVATFARRDADQSTTMDVTEVLEAAVTLTWNELKQCGQLVRALQPVAPIAGRRSELTELFVHLLLNAAQALQDRTGTITIGTEHDERGVTVTIRDTGRGIDAAALPRVFDPFYTTRSAGQGTGMGLAVCHGIVVRHGGTIQLQSAPDQGTTVSVHLPVAARATQPG
jgi:signal transduction histidine kinase